MERAKEAVSSVIQLPTCKAADPIEFSFWLACNLPLSNDMRQVSLRAMFRLTFIRSFLMPNLFLSVFVQNLLSWKPPTLGFVVQNARKELLKSK